MRYLLDTNCWIALAIEDHEHHITAAKWLSGLDPVDQVVFCRATLQALLRLLSTAAVYHPYRSRVATNAQAWSIADRFFSASDVVFEENEPPGLDALWRQYSTRASASPKLWMDAYLAAFARAGNLRFVTFDTAFNQFDGLDPLVLS